jgi:outer membrane protein OmpA-like peptidoglycan-associated protein
MRRIRTMPADCLSLLADPDLGTLKDWRGMVAVEHCDRIKRLLRISAGLPEPERPIFFEADVLASRLSPDIGVQIPILRVVFPERVFFDTGSVQLKPAALEVARIIADDLRREPPDVVMFVAGHADARGSRPYNAKLSIDRANALAGTVLGEGVRVASVWRVGFGEDLPLASGNDEIAYAQNRRIEFLFSAKAEAIAAWLVDQQLDELCQGQTSAQIDQCKRNLQFEREYVVAEVHAPERSSLASIRPLPHRTISPGGSKRKLESVDSSNRHNIQPATPSSQILETKHFASRAIDLHRPTMFKLDLSSRHSKPIYDE